MAMPCHAMPRQMDAQTHTHIHNTEGGAHCGARNELHYMHMSCGSVAGLQPPQETGA